MKGSAPGGAYAVPVTLAFPKQASDDNGFAVVDIVNTITIGKEQFVLGGAPLPLARTPTCSGVVIAIPDHTTLSRRGGGLTILPKRIERGEPLHLIIDSTGLKIYGEGEWLDQRHGIRSRRRWRKLHLGIDADTHEIVAADLTPDDVGDVSELSDLLDQIDADVASVIADGAYDAEALYDAVTDRHPQAAVIIPRRETVVPSQTTTTQRDRHLQVIEKHGRMNWQHSSGCNRRSLEETAISRYKSIVGWHLHARTLRNQRTEAKIGCNALNRMMGLGMPISVRIV